MLNIVLLTVLVIVNATPNDFFDLNTDDILNYDRAKLIDINVPYNFVSLTNWKNNTYEDILNKTKVMTVVKTEIQRPGADLRDLDVIQGAETEYRLALHRILNDPEYVYLRSITPALQVDAKTVWTERTHAGCRRLAGRVSLTSIARATTTRRRRRWRRRWRRWSGQRRASLLGSRTWRIARSARSRTRAPEVEICNFRARDAVRASRRCRRRTLVLARSAGKRVEAAKGGKRGKGGKSMLAIEAPKKQTGRKKCADSLAGIKAAESTAGKGKKNMAALEGDGLSDKIE